MLRVLYESSFGNPQFNIAVAIKLMDCINQVALEYIRNRKPRRHRPSDN
jgi:hypothetical protein